MRPLASALILIALSHFGASAATIEEVLAVVGDTPILVSDLALAAAVEIVPRDDQEVDATFHERVLDSLIRLELQYQDLEASASLDRLEIESEPLARTMYTRCATDGSLHSELQELGLLSSDVESLAHRVAAVTAYVDQRLLPRISVSFQELESAYRELIQDPITAVGEEPPPLVSVRERLADVVTERKLNAEIERWLEQARERLEVTRFRR
ncbi:MAG: hypothetical protein GY906_02240 [bacterium]|nr:hypothetical protein [bacterium]